MAIAVLAAVAVFLAYVILVETRPGTEAQISLWLNLFSNGAAATATAAAAAAATRLQGKDRHGWAFIALGFGCWTLGDFAWTAYGLAGQDPPPYPGIPDIGYLAMVPPLVIGLTKLNGGDVWQRRTRRTFEPMALLLAIMAVVWHFVMMPVFRDGEASVIERIVGCAYPAADLVVFGTALLTVWGNRRSPAWTGQLILASGLGLIMASDVVYTFLALHDSFYQGHLVDYGWMGGLLLVALAGVYHAILRPKSASTPSSTALPPVARMALPLVMIPFAVGFALFVALRGELASDPTLVVLVLFISVAVTVEPALVIIDNSRLNGLLGRARDELERRVLERTRDVVNAEAKFRLLNESAPDAMLVTDAAGRVVSWNPGAVRMFGLGEQEIVGRDFFSKLPAFPRAGTVERITSWAALVSASVGQSTPVEVMGTRSNGHLVPLEVSLSHWQTDEGQFYGAVMRDVSDRRRHEEQLRYYAESDALTGLMNRRRLERELEREMARMRQSGASGALLIIDLDHFKGVNDNLGHRSGDDLLVSVASLLRSAVGPEALVARLGGDEFAVLVPDADGAAVQGLAERLLAAFRGRRVEIQAQAISVTASIGIALYPEHAQTSAELQVRADKAMYRAKDHRDRWQMYSPGADDGSMSLQRPWEQKIRDALESDGFVLEFQPISDRDGVIQQWEALIRMQGEDGELIPPGAFLPTAERSGLIQAIDRWVVRRAIELIAEENAAGRQLRLEVNLSGRAFADPALVSLIEDLLASARIDPRQLILEITETAAIADIEEARAFIGKLKALGCLFALDDFGTGFSSLSLLKQLPVDYLKIDGSFIRNLSTDTTDQQLVRAIAQMARALGKQTIAEFVSDAESVILLQRFGVDYAQGHHVGRPGRLHSSTVAAPALAA
ncbi:MAG: putative bifunctional diguanylate cyclase/phosphodiesterase [Dehalococcoidia bacterium]